ncbi:succinylglutamate desuccinylase/aspartoacylase family protein [Meridianimarinicoccus sp. RP-17]|uniref:succinylglutamate desuccinylase/aspartoacylase family protein n=1 Tax=Meridianimarinicoccus zhengii TaxID=2056810 RepID=UPI000DACB178|nr:succinylglutamate desuccinylase/aspartoacylase family protein [Phycocomes zhengii]
MTRTAFAIGGQLVAPGKRRTINMPVSVLSDHTPVTMSAHVIHGRKPGPVVCITAGIHGDEVIGVEIVRRLLALPRLDGLSGTLIAVPIVNAYGFMNHSRYLPDRRDLNRCFPGSPGGSLAARLAHLLLSEVVERCDLGIDLHSAAVNRTNLPQVRVAPDQPELMRLAMLFGAPVVLRSKLRDGSLRMAAQDRDIGILLYEAGEGLRFDEYGVRTGVTGILRILADRGMIPPRSVPKARKQPMLCKASLWLRAPQGGLLRMFRSEGDVVQAGDLLAMVSDPFGEVETEITAPEKGVIVGRAIMPIVNEGDALFHLAAIGSADVAEQTVEALANQMDESTLFDEDEII